jgi:hypothetical protein
MKFNAEQITQYLNMEAQYADMTRRFKEVTDTETSTISDADYADLCRRYTFATVQMVKMRSFVKGAKV